MYILHFINFQASLFIDLDFYYNFQEERQLMLVKFRFA